MAADVFIVPPQQTRPSVYQPAFGDEAAIAAPSNKSPSAVSMAAPRQSPVTPCSRERQRQSNSPAPSNGGIIQIKFAVSPVPQQTAAIVPPASTRNNPASHGRAASMRALPVPSGRA